MSPPFNDELNVVVTEANLPMIQTWIQKDIISKLPTVQMLYDSVVMATSGRRQSSSGTSAVTTASSRRSGTPPLSGLFLLLWDAILTVPSTQPHPSNLTTGLISSYTSKTPLPDQVHDETIRSYLHRCVLAHILHQILIPVVQQIYASSAQQQQCWLLSTTLMNAMASSINYQLISVKGDHHDETNVKELVRLVRQFLDYLPTHPALLSPLSSSSTRINPLTESLLKYCTNIGFLHDVGILTTTTTTNTDRDEKETKKMVDQLVSKRLRMINTAVHYRQYKFNLFVEESEGYAKLIRYLTSPPPQSVTNQSRYEEDLYATLHSIIGTFYLDPNRCLDIVIDLLEYEFFIHQGPPAFDVVIEPQQQLFVYMFAISVLNSTTKLPQLMGYKLQCRQKMKHDTTNRGTMSMSSFNTASLKASNNHNIMDDRTVPCDTLSLLYCTAWLCVQPQYMTTTTTEDAMISPQPLLDPKAMISYIHDDVWIHNSTTAAATTTESYEEILEYVYEQHVKSEKGRIRNVGRVSLTANSNNTNEMTETKESRKNGNQNYTIGTVEEHCITQWIAIFLQNRQFTSAIQSLLSTPHWSMLSVLLPHTIGIAILDHVQTYVSWCRSAIEVYSPAESTSVPWSSTPSNDKDNIDKSVVIPKMEDVVKKIFDPLMFTMESGSIAMRPTLYCQICRLLTLLVDGPNQQRTSKDSDNDVVMSDSHPNNDTAVGRNDSVSIELLNFLQSYLVPCLSAFHSNPAISMELWNVIQALPYSKRYSLYAGWRGDGLEQRSLLVPLSTTTAEAAISKPLWLIEGELRTGKDIRYALKRISKDTIRDMSRAVAKCCHGHPLVVFTTILNQIESYDNLVQVMVDACRFVTPLSLDVLGYCILQRLSDSNDATSENRSRLKANGVNVSQWLQSLETFAGAFYKRFPYVEFQGLLFYLLQRLKDGHVMELGVLRTLLKNGAGWSFADYSPAESLSMTQLEGRAGSTRLKRETMTFGVVSDINLSASNEVRRVLHNNNIGVSLLILLAQVRHSIIFQKSQRFMPVKLIGNLVDTSQVVMSILLDFLTNEVNHDGAEIGSKSTAIREYASSLPTLVELQHQYKVEVASSWTLCRPLLRSARSVQSSDVELAKRLSPSIPRERLTEMVSKFVWKHISTDLFEFFYSAATYDIFCPCDVYENEILRLERETERLSQKKNAPPPTSIQPGAITEKSDREEFERVKQMVIGLKEDYCEQKMHVASINETLISKIPDFFVSDVVTIPSAVQFFTRCIYPRCMQGPDDAMYCAHFVALLHQNKTPGFSTLHYFDALIQILPRSLYCLTEGEAASASILLLDAWKTISRWRYDDPYFETDLVGTPGSFMVTNTNDDPVAVSKQDYENLYNKWHAAIGDTLVGCLQSKEYIHLRCGLIVLTRIVDEYPTRPKLANALLQALEPLKEESNPFADIRASSQAYSMQLLRSRDNGVWKEEDAATVRARLALVEAAAMERQKKAQEQMEQIERDSENITSKIGVSETRGRGRGPTMLRSNSDERLNRSNVSASDMNRRRAATSSGPMDDGFRGVGSTSANSGVAGGTSSFSSYASIPPTAQGGESSATSGSAGRSLDGRWQHSTSGTTPPRNPGSSMTSSNIVPNSKSGTTSNAPASSNITNTRKRGRLSSSPTTASEQQPDESTSAKRAKVSQSDGESKRTRTRHNGGARRT